MSQSIQSTGVLPTDYASTAAAAPQPDRSDERSGSEFAAHLRQAGRDAADNGSARTVRVGGSPERPSGRDPETDRADGANGSAASGQPADAAAAGGATLAPTADPGVTAAAPTGPADPAALAAAAGLPAGAPGSAAATATAAKTGPTVAPVVGATAPAAAGPQAQGVAPVGAGTVADGGKNRGNTRPGGAPSTSGTTAGSTSTTGSGSSAGPATATTAATATATTTAGDVLTATASGVVGTADPSAVLPAPTHTGVGPQFQPLATGSDASAVTATASSTAASAPAPTTTAPQTSVASQLSASLRTLAGRGDGVHVMTVRLHPDELGPVRVVARMTGTDIHLRVTTSTVAAATAVSEAGPRLHAALAGSGLNPTGVSVDHDADLGQPAQSNQSASSNQPGHHGHQGANTAGASADSRDGARTGADRHTGSGPPGSGRGDGSLAGSLAADVHQARHPLARSLDLHV